MKFLYPDFLYFLFFLAVPIIIHLFSFRRFRKIYFSDIRFLKEIKQERRATSRLRHLLVLMTRLLFIFFLVAAFAQPYIPGENQASGQAKMVSIYVDNSFSMNATGPGGRLLDMARAKAREIAMAYQSGDRFQIITNDFEGQHQQLVSREVLLDHIDRIEESPAFRTTAEVVSRQNDLLQNEGANDRKDIYLISDFQKSSTDLEGLPEDSSTSIFLVQLPVNQASNLYIDSVWFPAPVRSPEGTEQVTALVRNPGNRALENVPLQLFINDQQRTMASFSIDEGASQEITFSFNQGGPGIKHGRISLQDHPITYDDDFYFSYTVEEQIGVLLIEGGTENNYLKSFFDTEPYFRLERQNARALDYSILKNYPVLILHEVEEVTTGMSSALSAYVENGGHLVVIPPAEASESLNQLLSQLQIPLLGTLDTTTYRVDNIETRHEIFSGVFEELPDNTNMPVVRKHFRLSSSGERSLLPIMRMAGGGVFLGSADRGSGRVYHFSTPLRASHTSFPQHAFFVPVFYKMIISSQRSGTIYHYTGSDDLVRFNGNLTGKDKLVTIRAHQGDFEMAPEVMPSGGNVYLRLHNAIGAAGNYLVIYENEAVQGLALNYPRKESDLAVFENTELTKLAEGTIGNVSVIDKTRGDLTRSITEKNIGTPLWKYCIWIALFLLAIEILLLRLASKSYRQNRASTV